MSLEHGSSESGLAVDTGGDIESGRIPVPKAAGIRKLLSRYTRRQSEVYAESTHLVISVEDSGAGISTVFPSSPSQLLRLRNLIIQYHYHMTGESDQAVQRSGAVPSRVTAEGTGHGTGTLQ